MPALAQHKAAAKRFLSLYEAIPGDYPEGKAIALFYSALHLVEAVAASQGVHNRTHSDRRNYITDNHRSMWQHFRPLWEASEQARYMADGGFKMNSEQIEYQLRRRRLRAFELWSAKLLGDEPDVPEPSGVAANPQR